MKIGVISSDIIFLKIATTLLTSKLPKRKLSELSREIPYNVIAHGAAKQPEVKFQGQKTIIQNCRFRINIVN